MKIQIQRTELLRALFRVQGIVERKPTTRFAAHVLLEADDAGVTVSATDSDLSLSGRYGAHVLVPGAITAHARQFYDIVRSLSGETVEVESSKLHWLKVRCSNSAFHVAGGSADEFPAIFELASQDHLTLPSATFLQMIDRTLFCVSNDENRHTLAGVFCEPVEGDKLRMVSTDGHRLALAESVVAEAQRLGQGVLLPKKGLVECRRLLMEAHGEGDVSLGISDQGAVVQFGSVTLTTRLIDSSFVNYRQVIPQSSSKEASIGRVAFADALKRVSLLSQSRTWGVRLNFTGDELVLEAEDPEHGEARESLSVQYEGEPLRIGFNARYILDVLALITTSDVRFALTDEHSPGVLKPGDDDSFISIVMPMRV